MSNDLRWIYKQKIKSCYVGIWSKFLAWISFPHMIDSSQIEKLYLSYHIFPLECRFWIISIGLFHQKRENEKSYQCGTALYQSHLVVQTCSENFCFCFVLFELAGIIEKGGIIVRKHRVYHAGDLYHLGILRPKFFCIFMWRLDIKIRKHRSLDHIFFFQNCPLTVYYYGSFPRMPKCEVEHAYSRNTDWSM